MLHTNTGHLSLSPAPTPASGIVHQHQARALSRDQRAEVGTVTSTGQPQTLAVVTPALLCWWHRHPKPPLCKIHPMTLGHPGEVTWGQSVPEPTIPSGYANEVGESFRPLVPVPVVWASYGVATAYVTADAIDKGRKAAAAHPQDPTRVGVAVVDTFVWQSLASVAIPGFTINRLCAASLALLGSLTRWPLPVRRWTTTALGLAAIPLIITPIDRTVDFLMDSSLRKLYRTPGEPPTSH
ncbi:mitochondrial fission process protein 1 isoform X1 [Oenanthe melanoleuca]|uniref:mitochondrial fission process protein 1 isoform X1 n=1 Tax=Oenanthe melanoleuca TaxID=2939378 RepID=UPI0024C1863B|nr:mitochondrial fission process protein 1 isoform X1 [Oenanthe melanoleuca]